MILSLTIFVFIFLCFVVDVFMRSNFCKNKILYTKISGLNKVVLFKRSCGATTDISIQVSILNRNDKLQDKAGNVFIVDHNYGNVPFRSRKIKINWKNKFELVIMYHKKARVFLKRELYNGIKIRYSFLKR